MNISKIGFEIVNVAFSRLLFLSLDINSVCDKVDAQNLINSVGKNHWHFYCCGRKFSSNKENRQDIYVT
jgi:hypothetical protein